jgi:hypothetical protein
VIHVLHHKEIQAVEDVVACVLVNPRMSRVRADDPQPLDLFTKNSLDDAVVGPAILVRDQPDVDAQHVGHFLAMRGILEVVAAQQVRRVAE